MHVKGGIGAELEIPGFAINVVDLEYVQDSLLKRSSCRVKLRPTNNLNMPSFGATVAEIRENPAGGCTLIVKPNKLATTTDLRDVSIEPKFATAGGIIHKECIELYCTEKPSVCQGQRLTVSTVGRPED